MTAERRIIGNSALLGGLEGIGQVVNLATVVLLTRAYGLSALGGAIAEMLVRSNQINCPDAFSSPM